MPLCLICGGEFSDDELFEGVLCYSCKRKQDNLDFEEEKKAFEEDMLKYNHKNRLCWLTGKTLCKEGWCERCSIYLQWKEELKSEESKEVANA